MTAINDFLVEGRPFKTLCRKISVRSGLCRIQNFAITPYIKGEAISVGAGKQRFPGVVSLDLNPLMSPDYLMDAYQLHTLGLERWDTVIASHLVEHLPDPPRFYEIIWKVLRPEGNFIMLFPNFERMGSVGYYRDWTHLHRMYPGEVWAQFKRHGGWDIVSFNKLAYLFPYSFDLVVRKK